jgi:hypothetical protein
MAPSSSARARSWTHNQARPAGSRTREAEPVLRQSPGRSIATAIAIAATTRPPAIQNARW